ncbi:MAG: hypothetical protein WC505_00450 [Patescibacteria group bacterium]
MTNDHEQTQAEIERRARIREKKRTPKIKSSGRSVRELQRIIVEKGRKVQQLDRER